MSKERARRRAEREREAALLAAAKAAETERRERRDALRRVVTSRLPKRSASPAGVIAERRRTQTRLLVAGAVAVNVLVWLAAGDWALSFFALLITLLIAPVAHILMTKN